MGVRRVSEVRRPVLQGWLLTLGVSWGMAASAQQFTLASPSVISHARLPQPHVSNGRGCSGANLSPALRWRAAPRGTKSFAVTMHDADAPTWSERWHWMVLNIPVAVDELVEGAGTAGLTRLPDGAVHARSDFGILGYAGACPPAGAAPHRYRISVHALDVERIEVRSSGSSGEMAFHLARHRLAKATIIANYGR